MVFCWHVLLEYDVPSPERGETFTEHYLGTPFHSVTDGTDTGMVGLTQEGSAVPTSLLNLTHATIPSNKQRKALH